MFICPHYVTGIIATDRDIEEYRRVYSDGDHRGWGDKCDNCNHSRADHIVHESVKTVDGVSDCNVKVVDPADKTLAITCGCKKWQKN